MDPDLYKLLPSGGEFWTYKNTNAEKFLQKNYISDILEQKSEPEISILEPEIIKQEKIIEIEIFEYILTKIDNIYSMYPDSLKDTAQKALKKKLEEILTSADGQLFFGSRKTRSIMAWLGGNVITESSEPIIAGFLSFILDEIIISDKKKLEGEYNWILHKVAGKKRRENVWLLKNDKT